MTKHLTVFQESKTEESSTRPTHQNRVENGPKMQERSQKRSQPSKPLVSIITVVRNGKGHLERAIQSVINQYYDNIEYIIIDGASTDGTIDIIKKYEDCIDYWMSESDDGLYDAMNKGVRIARGDWIYFLGCDDVLLDQLNYIASNLKECNTIYYGDVYMPRLHKIYDGKFNPYKLMFKNICHQSIFYPKKVFEKYSYGQKYKIWADYYLNLKCYGDKDFRFAYLPILVAVFNDRNGISRKGEDIEFINDRMSIVEANFSRKYFLLFCLKSTLDRILEKLRLRETLKFLIKKCHVPMHR